MANTAKVQSGSEKITSATLVGQTVASIREKFRNIWNIPSDANPFIDGSEVEDDTVLHAGEVLTFSRPTGQKGC